AGLGGSLKRTEIGATFAARFRPKVRLCAAGDARKTRTLGLILVPSPAALCSGAAERRKARRSPTIEDRDPRAGTKGKGTYMPRLFREPNVACKSADRRRPRGRSRPGGRRVHHRAT